jgi:hypothetical protein
MLPDAVLSSQRLPAAFQAPRNVRREPLVDFDLGGIALQDPSQGLDVQTWRAEVIGDDVVLSADTVAPFVAFTQPGITEVAVTFDQNMQLFLAYMIEDEIAQFRWYDATIPGFVITTLPAGSCYPRCALDDKRASQTGSSDIILTYMRDGALYFRAQRDRYEIEYQLATGLDGYMIGQFGMHVRWRMQWQLVPKTHVGHHELPAT